MCDVDVLKNVYNIPENVQIVIINNWIIFGYILIMSSNALILSNV